METLTQSLIVVYQHANLRQHPRKKVKTADIQTSPIVQIKMSPTARLIDAATSPFENQKALRYLENVEAHLNAHQEAFFTRLTRVKMQQSGDKSTVWCKTRGQPIVLKKVTQPCKTSALMPRSVSRKSNFHAQNKGEYVSTDECHPAASF